VIDSRGFRSNVGLIIVNNALQVLWAKCSNKYANHEIWQFPQGGISPYEDLEAAMYRELYEEVGLGPHQVKILDRTHYWLNYRLPERLVRRDNHPVCVGQKQKWFLLKLCADDSAINLNPNNNDSPELESWQWVSYWYPISKVVFFKREVYRQALKDLAVKLA